MRASALTLLTATVAATGSAVGGCGGSKDGTSCQDTVCTVRSDGPGTYTLDQQATEVQVSDLTADSVRVRVNSAIETLMRDAEPVRMRGFLVSAPETSPGHVEIRVER